MRLAGHQLGEVVFIAGDRFSYDYRSIVGRASDHAFDRILNRKRAAGLETQLGGTLAGRFLRYVHLAVELELAGLELLEQQIKRHDFGKGGWVPPRVRIGLVQ